MNATTPPAVNIIIRQIRESAGVSQAELARRLRISQPTVARWESGRRNMHIDTLQRIADALDFSLAVIFSPAPPKTE